MLNRLEITIAQVSLVKVQSPSAFPDGRFFFSFKISTIFSDQFSILYLIIDNLLSYKVKITVLKQFQILKKFPLLVNTGLLLHFRKTTFLFWLSGDEIHSHILTFNLAHAENILQKILSLWISHECNKVDRQRTHKINCLI